MAEEEDDYDDIFDQYAMEEEEEFHFHDEAEQRQIELMDRYNMYVGGGGRGRGIEIAEEEEQEEEEEEEMEMKDENRRRRRTTKDANSKVPDDVPVSFSTATEGGEANEAAGLSSEEAIREMNKKQANMV